MPCVRATAALLPAAGEVEGVDAGCLLGALYLLVSSSLLLPEILTVRRVARKPVRESLRCVPPPRAQEYLTSQSGAQVFSPYYRAVEEHK
jgi:hypothetical protein